MDQDLHLPNLIISTLDAMVGNVDLYLELRIREFENIVNNKLAILRSQILKERIFSELKFPKNIRELSFWNNINDMPGSIKDFFTDITRITYYGSSSSSIDLYIDWKNKVLTNVRLEVNSYGVYDYKMHGHDYYGYVENMMDSIPMSERDIMKSNYKDDIDWILIVGELRQLMEFKR